MDIMIDKLEHLKWEVLDREGQDSFTDNYQNVIHKLIMTLNIAWQNTYKDTVDYVKFNMKLLDVVMSLA